MNGNAPSSGCQFGKHMVDQRPVFDNAVRKKKRRKFSDNQIMSRSGVIRPDKRKKAKYL